MTRYIFRAMDIGASTVFLALCTKAFSIYFYQDIERRLFALKLPTIKDTPSPIPSDEIVDGSASIRLASSRQPSSY